MQVVIYSRVLKEADIIYIQELFEVLKQERITTYVYSPYLEQLRKRIPIHESCLPFDGYEQFKKHKIDMVITLGGDGTILHAVTMIRDALVPIMGINLGRLGFLAGVEKKKIKQAFQSVKAGSYLIDERKLIYLESSQPIFGEMSFALNDCTLLKRDTSSMITIHTFINGAYLNSYWADGIIVATPTGSTGYSLSCGGPIILPHSGNFVITPVAPHNMNVRPIVVSDNSIISFQVEGRADNFLCTLDSRFRTITSEHELAVRKCDFPTRLIRFPETGFLSTLRIKLNWGKDSRNH